MSFKNNISDEQIINYLVGESTLEEKTKMENWLLESKENQDRFNSFQKIWNASANLEEDIKVHEDEAWTRLEARMPKSSGLKGRRTILGIAATLFLLIGGFWFWGQVNSSEELEPIGVVKTDTTKTERAIEKEKIIVNEIVPKDSSKKEEKQLIAKEIKTSTIESVAETKTRKLEDKSTVILNRRSSISKPQVFTEDERRVALKGEAFFDIEPNKAKPFYIETQNNVTIKVVGTSFNVKSFANYTEVIVESGIVELDNGSSNIRLRKNQRAKVYKNQKVMKIRQTDDELYKYYRSKFFDCDETPLWKLVEVLNEAYDERIVIENESLKDLPLTVRFDNVKLKVLLEVLSETFEVKVKKRKGVYIIY